MSKRITPLIILIITIVAGAICIQTITRAAFVPEVEPEAEVAVTQEVIKALENPPTRFVIPRLEIDTAVQDVGVTKKGTMGVPDNYTDVGWYRYGALPGAEGNAVIAGHVNNGFGKAGVFEKLHTLSEGDDIYITDSSNRTVHFKVTSHQLYERTSTSTEDIFSKEGKPQLRLITCEGEWDPEIKQYSDRRVVTARLVGSIDQFDTPDQAPSGSADAVE